MSKQETAAEALETALKYEEQAKYETDSRLHHHCLRERDWWFQLALQREKEEANG